MAVFNRRKLESALLSEGLVDRKVLIDLIAESRHSGKRVARLLLEKKLITEEQLLKVLEKELGIGQVNLSLFPIDQQLIARLPAEVAARYLVLPLTGDNGRITLAMSDPLDLEAIDYVARLTGTEIVPVLARDSAIRQLITRFYGLVPRKQDEQNKVVRRSPGDNLEPDVDLRSSGSPAVQIVNSLIEQAVAEGASDIHLEPGEKELRIRMRLDGVLHDLASPAGQLQSQIISRVKIMANLDIAEKRLPQDGNIDWQEGRAGINLRVSTLPTINGEKIVIRLLEKQRIVLPLEELGFSEDNYNLFLRLLLNQHGLLLVTGPTGCGKTTTLYSALNHLNRPQKNIITVEDPVEYRLKGINQVQVNRKINRTFANALRSILRQDPNIIMVGEIRDPETATITVQSALTGHLVLSTLHTNNAAGAVTRLTDMGLEKYLVNSSLLGVIAQRLVRRICPDCATEYSLSEQEKNFFRGYFDYDPPDKLWRGAKCGRCNQTGYKGRQSIQEVLMINHRMHELIMEGATTEDLQQCAVEQGLCTLVKDGLRLILAGKTTVREIVRSTFNTIIDTGATLDKNTIAYLSTLQRDQD